MKKLDENKFYYLGDLSDEQKEDILYQLRLLEPKYNWSKFLQSSDYLAFCNEDKEWFEGSDLGELRKDLDNEYPLVNALTLFEQTDNDRIIALQLEEQKLNNRLLEIAEEMKELTYAK